MSQNVTSGSHASSMKHRRRCSSTGGTGISDDKLYEGYLVDDDGKVIGEARRYDPYSQFGHLMLYEVDSFGFVPGYIKKGIRLMSAEDLKTDKNLRKEFKESQYQVWKRCNITELKESYEMVNPNYKEGFERFCREIFEVFREY